MTKNTKSFVLPLTFIGIMFFAIGFALGINSLLVPVLQKSLGISNTASYKSEKFLVYHIEYGFLSDYRCDIHSFSSFRLSCRTHN